MPRHPDPLAPYSKARARMARATVLPASGCSLPPPKMPGGRRWSAFERRAWRDLWSSPQANEWDESAALSVARYLVLNTAVLADEAAAWQAAEARHLGDALGLTPRGMQQLGWRLSEPGEVVEMPTRGGA